MSELPKVGASAPDFTLQAGDGTSIRLSAFAGKGPVVLYFYPRADTPGCTKEACEFRDAMPDFGKINATVFGISPDPVEDVAKFATKFSLNFTLLADPDHSVADAYGVWQEKSMYGKKYWGVARTTFVIDSRGKVSHVFEQVKPEGHAAKVVDALRQSV